MFMNFFRIAGDMCHLLSFVVMFWKLHSSKSVAGISLKTQELYVIVFVARYLDLFWNFLSIYNWVRAHASRAERAPGTCAARRLALAPATDAPAACAPARAGDEGDLHHRFRLDRLHHPLRGPSQGDLQ